MYVPATNDGQLRLNWLNWVFWSYLGLFRVLVGLVLGSENGRVAAAEFRILQARISGIPLILDLEPDYRILLLGRCQWNSNKNTMLSKPCFM